MEKYKFTGKTKEIKTVLGLVILHQIEAVQDLKGVQAGELGGWIEKEENLSHKGDAWVCGNARVCSDACVCNKNHALTVGPVGSRNDYTTFFRDKDNGITVRCGCFLGKMNDFIEEVRKTHGDNKYAQAYRKAAELAELQIDCMGEGDKEKSEHG